MYMIEGYKFGNAISLKKHSNCTKMRVSTSGEAVAKNGTDHSQGMFLN